mgnify:CR=1 FL=1
MALQVRADGPSLSRHRRPEATHHDLSQTHRAMQRSVRHGPRLSPMIGMVLVTHGRLAEELRSAMEHVVGPQEAPILSGHQAGD